ncbi:MAG: AurF N-oxygenase family protein [Gemmatimonadota bacterium]
MKTGTTADGQAPAGRQATAVRERTADRERTAERLLRSTAARSYDPELDIDWSAPLAEGKGFLLEHRSTLYGTPLWDRLTPEQRRELGKHEAASIAGTGIWLECILMRLLAKLTYDGDPASGHVRYAFAEMAEECRHSTMFAMMIERMGTPVYRPNRVVHNLGKMLPAIAYGPAVWGAILIGEELTDRYQREMADSDEIQPLMRMVNRIHIMEEARHIGFARAELARTAARLSRAERAYQRGVLAHIGYIVARNLINPEVYRSVGLDPREARRVALANPHHQQTVRYGGEKIMAFFAENGLVGQPGMRWWRKSFLLP